MSIKLTRSEVARRLSDATGGEIKLISGYFKMSEKVLVKHIKCGYMWEVLLNNVLINGSRCPKCSHRRTGETLRKNPVFFEAEVKRLVGNEYRILGRYITSKTPLIMRHNTCGYEYDIRPHNFLSGSRCPKCFGAVKLSNEEFLSRVRILTGDEYEFTEPYINSSSKIGVIHKYCGNEYKVRPTNFFVGNRCPKCAAKKSKGEKRISEILTRLGIPNKEQYPIGGVLRADFYLQEYQAYIEFDGRHHFESIDVWGGDEEFSKVVRRDAIKNHYCRFLGFPLLRIPYWEFDNIPQIVTEFIEELEEERKKRKEDDLLDGE